MPHRKWPAVAGTAGAALLVAGLMSSAGIGDAKGIETPPATLTAAPIDPSDRTVMSALLDAIDDSRVVFVGETHDRYDHHLNQLAVIRGLHRRGHQVAIGMEAFQRPFQRHLDDYVAGRIDETTLFARTQWAERWRFDERLYRDILRYARANRIPLLALNASSETVRQVSLGGIDALADTERALFPPRIELAQGAYRRQLQHVFSLHGHLPPERLTRFLEVQYVWDQTMARTAADYLAAAPGTTLVMLTGSGHVLHDDAIPKRLRRLAPGKQSVLVTDTGGLPGGASPDYVFAARQLRPEGGPLPVARAGRSEG